LLIADDGRGGEYPRRLWQLPGDPGARSPYRSGSIVRGIEGIVDHRHGSWRVQLTDAVGRIEQAPRPRPPVRDPALLRVASFNVLNFFNGDGRDGGFPTERGAGSRNDLKRQRDKLVAAMRALDADVYALMEIENDGYAPHSAIDELVRALSEDPQADVPGGPARFTRVDPHLHRLGSDTISVGLIYRSDRIRPVDTAHHLAGGPFGDDSRVPLAQAFAGIDAGDDSAFLVVVNHFKSKGCRDANDANRDTGDGQSCFAATRADSARRLLEWLRAGRAGLALDHALVLGDLNAYREEVPLRILRDGGLRDLLGDDPDHYSFVYRGQAGRLDHALAGTRVAARVRKAGIWHVNADELPEFDYDGDAHSGRRLFAADAWRSSDHDPVYIDLTR
jgi:predicted extracellular nuclease